MPWWGYLIIGIIVVLIGILVALVVFGRKLQESRLSRKSK